MSKGSTTTKRPPLDVGDGFLKKLAERGAYEEDILDQMKVALDEKDKNTVFKLAQRFFYEGPGIISPKA